MEALPNELILEILLRTPLLIRITWKLCGSYSKRFSDVLDDSIKDSGKNLEEMIITNQPHTYAHSSDEWIIHWDDFIPFVAHGLHYNLFYSHMLPNITTIIVENSD